MPDTSCRRWGLRRIYINIYIYIIRIITCLIRRAVDGSYATLVAAHIHQVAAVVVMELLGPAVELLSLRCEKRNRSHTQTHDKNNTTHEWEV